MLKQHSQSGANNKIQKLYQELLKAYGPQGWWPIAGRYHPKDFSCPKDENERFEICAGAILTQSISWLSVEKALSNLRNLKAISPEHLLKLSDKELTEAIRPAGYFNQKAKKLRIFAEFYIRLGSRIPSRNELLALWGIGPETADSILLYAYSQPEFVIDAYTKRIMHNLGLIKENASYNSIKELFESNLGHDFRLFQEYHALLVEHAKRCYAGKPYNDFVISRII